MSITRRNIDHKLLHYLQYEGHATEELAEVERWINRNPKNRAHFEQLKKLWEEKQFIESLKAIDVDKIRAGLQQKIDKKQIVSEDVPVFQRSRVWLYRVAAVALILVVSATTLLLFKTGRGNSIQQVGSILEITEVVLFDGSIIEMNKGSTLSYPEHMDRRKREVTLSGEAFFKVASNRRAPFCVYVGPTTVQVLGTSFNLKEVEGKITLSVIEGEVRFFKSGKEKQGIGLRPGQKAIYDTATGVFDLGTFESQNFLFWKTSTLTYKAEPLTSIFDELEKYFNTTIVIADNKILQDQVTTSCEGQQLQEILDELSFLHDLHYIRKNDTIYVYKKEQ
jgi:transmembrane sensor